MARRSPSPSTILGFATVILLATSLAPTRYTRWVGWFRGPFMTLIAPASGPVTAVSEWLRPAATQDRFENSTEEELARQVRELELDYLRSLARIEELEGLIDDIERYDQPVRKLKATRVSANLSAGTFDVSRGKRNGVRGGTVAVARGSEQLVGIVTAAGPLTSTVHVLTDRRLEPNLMVGIVVREDARLDEASFADAPRAQFRSMGGGGGGVGGGTLFAESVGADDATRMQPGDLVRLADQTWPSSAQMLILGRVTRIEPTDDMLFYNVTARPLADLARLRSVILFVPEPVGPDDDDDDGGGGGTP